MTHASHPLATLTREIAKAGIAAPRLNKAKTKSLIVGVALYLFTSDCAARTWIMAPARTTQKKRRPLKNLRVRSKSRTNRSWSPSDTRDHAIAVITKAPT